MFDLEYKGGNTVVITTKKAKLITDPKQSVVGLKDVSTKGVIELATEERLALNSPDALIAIESPGEYEISDFSIRGIAMQRHIDTEADPQAGIAYRIEVGDVRIALLGNITGKLSDEQLESIGVVDMVILPVGGGGYTLDATAAAALARQFDAHAVIPVHYADKALTYEVPQDDFDVFVKELGAPVEETAKLKVKSAAALPQVLTIIKVTRS